MARDERVQELARCLDATLASVNSEGLASGQNLLAIWQFLLGFPNMDMYITREFLEFVRLQLVQAEEAYVDQNSNLRKHMKQILMWPTQKYEPWEAFAVDFRPMQQVAALFQKAVFRLGIVHGKLYAVCLTDDLCQQIFAIVQPDGLKPSSEVCHITLINSDVVAGIGVENMQQVVDTWNHRDIVVEPVKFQKTTSRDWTPFSTCVVVIVQSDLLNEFVNEVNERFGCKIGNGDKHVTIAVQPRTLWN